MSRNGRWLLRGGVAILAVACGKGTTPPPDTYEALSEGVVARVGAVDIRSGTVEDIAKEQQVAKKVALDHAVFDALVAQQGRAELSAVTQLGAERSVLARAMLERLWEQAQQGAITAEELADFTERHWVRYDRPKGYVVVHAVARLKNDASTEDVQAAAKLAERLHAAAEEAAQSARDKPAPPQREPSNRFYQLSEVDPAEEAFTKATKAVEVADAKIEVRVETLPPLSADGRQLSYGAPNQIMFDGTFSKAVAELGKRGMLSKPLKTGFGYHVILVLDTTAPYQAGEAERRTQLRPEILNARVRRAEKEMLERQAKTLKPSLVVNVDELLMQVKIQ